MAEQTKQFDYGTGRRKNAVSRTRLYPGSGAITVNGREFSEYFPNKILQMIVQQALVLTNTVTRFDITVNVQGGGLSGQAQAVRHGISRALLTVDPNFRGALKKAGFLTRDARKKERKKCGLHGARKRPQYSKR